MRSGFLINDQYKFKSLLLLFTLLQGREQNYDLRKPFQSFYLQPLSPEACYGGVQGSQGPQWLIQGQGGAIEEQNFIIENKRNF